MEETFGGCRSATTNDAHYTNGLPTSQENLHCEIAHHNAEFSKTPEPAAFPFLNQRPVGQRDGSGAAPPRAKPLKTARNSARGALPAAVPAAAAFRFVQRISRPLRRGLQCRIESESGNAGVQAWNAK